MRAMIRGSILKIVVGASLFFLIAFHFLPYDTRVFLLNQTPITACNLEEINGLTCDIDHNKAKIPNVVHFVYVLADPTSDFPLQFSHCLSVFAAQYYWRPDQIYLHTNVGADSEPVARAKSGESGKWSRLIFNLPNFTINTVSVPTHAKNGVAISGMEHKSDFVRVKAVHDFGGVYIDMDVHPLRDIKPLRESGYGAVGGRQSDGYMNSGSFMSEKGGKMITLWLQRMNEVYDASWTTHSNGALTSSGESLSQEPCEMMVLGHIAFAPGGWGSGDVDKLFHVHGENEAPDLAGITQEEPLPAYDEPLAHVSGQLDDTPNWAIDYSCTFMLHAFAPIKPRHGVKHDGINPRNVLERRSNFARAVYTVAKDMYDKGLISMDDSDLGV